MTYQISQIKSFVREVYVHRGPDLPRSRSGDAVSCWRLGRAWKVPGALVHHAPISLSAVTQHLHITRTA